MTLPGGSRGGEPAGRTGVVLREPIPWPQLAHILLTARQTGYESAFVPEIAGWEALGAGSGARPGGMATADLRAGCAAGAVASARHVLARAGQRTRRDPSRVTIAAYVRTCLGLDEEVALSALKQMAGQSDANP